MSNENVVLKRQTPAVRKAAMAYCLCHRRARKRIMGRVHKQIQLLNEVARQTLGLRTARPIRLEPHAVADLLRSALTASRLLKRGKLSTTRKKPPSPRPVASLPRGTLGIKNLQSLEDALRAAVKLIR